MKFSIILATIPTLALAATNATINSQLRLAYFGDSAMMVSWNTFSHVDQPTVHWGLPATDLNNTATSSVPITYPTSSTYNNHVLVTGLKPNTTYFYLPAPLLHSNDTGTTELFQFTTSRVSGDATPFSMAVVVDLGTMGPQGLTTSAGKGVAKTNILRPNETNTIQSLAAKKDTFDFLWHPGDIAYADYWLKEEIQGFLPNTTVSEGWRVYESILNDFYDQMMTVTATKPWMVGPGNHEANCDNGGTTDKDHNITYSVGICNPGQTNFTGYKNHFRMPSVLSGGTGNFWYSFDHGMTHFVQLDTETDLGHGFIAPDEIGGAEGEGASPVNATLDAQTSWLAADLAAVNRTRTPWIVVAGHRPWYLSHANASGTICWMCKDVFEPIFLEYHVDLVMSGHSHVYERQAPLTPRQNYSRFSLDTKNATYGWSRLTFHNCTHLTHEFVASGNSTVVDTATLFKNRTCTVSVRSSNGSIVPISDATPLSVSMPSVLVFIAAIAVATWSL